MLAGTLQSFLMLVHARRAYDLQLDSNGTEILRRAALMSFWAPAHLHHLRRTSQANKPQVHPNKLSLDLLSKLDRLEVD